MSLAKGLSVFFIFLRNEVDSIDLFGHFWSLLHLFLPFLVQTVISRNVSMCLFEERGWFHRSSRLLLLPASPVPTLTIMTLLLTLVAVQSLSRLQLSATPRTGFPVLHRLQERAQRAILPLPPSLPPSFLPSLSLSPSPAGGWE